MLSKSLYGVWVLETAFGARDGECVHAVEPGTGGGGGADGHRGCYHRIVRKNGVGPRLAVGAGVPVLQGAHEQHTHTSQTVISRVFVNNKPKVYYEYV